MAHTRKRLIIVVLWLILSNLPYLLGLLSSSGNLVFSGFVFNPIDGHSYLSKMRQGWDGGWLFTLPYTAETGKGAFLFSFYLFLGHVSRLLGLDLVVTFHLARVLASIFLVYQIDRYVEFTYDEKFGHKDLAFGLVLFGAGLGWIVFLIGQMTTDFWVAEAYPFHSAYANPHFALGLGVLLWIFRITNSQVNGKYPLVSILSLLLSIIQPFGMVVVIVVLSVSSFVNWIVDKKMDLKTPVLAGLIGGGSLLYQYWTVQIDPILRLWNQQNITTSPALWDVIVSFSPAFILAVVFWFIKIRKREILSKPLRFSLVWFIAALVVMYIPFNLQRRFITGFSIPVFLLAMVVIGDLQKSMQQRYGLIKTIFVCTSVPTVILLVIAGCFGVMSKDKSLFLYRDEKLALNWIDEQTEVNAIIASSPEMGNFIPAYTGRKVLYGHPFETINASSQRDFLQEFFSNDYSAAEMEKFLQENKVDFLFIGPRERKYGFDPSISLGETVFQTDDVMILKIKQP